MGRHWKNLGEVPDSDDEQGDSQEDLDPLAAPSGSVYKASNEPLGHESDDEINLMGDRLREPDSVNEAAEQGAAHAVEDEQQEKGQQQQDQKQQKDTPRDQGDILPHPQDRTEPQPDEPPQHPPSEPPPPADLLFFPSQSSLSSISSLSPFPSLSLPLSPPLPPALPSSTPSDGPVQARPASPSLSFPILLGSPPRQRQGFVRELRPRKPIQQHPYLLENAQYTHFMKSHGVKPIRVAYGSNTPTTHDRPPVEEDSQEQEFVDDGENESQVRAEEQFTDTVYDFPTSPIGHGSASRSTAAALYTPTRTASTDRTSFLDDDDDDDERFPSPNILMHQRRLQHGAKGSVSRPRGASPADDAAAASRAKRARTQAYSPVRRAASSTGGNPVYIGSSPDRRSPSPVVLLSRHRRAINILQDEDDEDDEDVSRQARPPTPNASVLSPARSRTTSPERDEEDSSSDSGIVRNHGRRMRGVLPASWLRIGEATTAVHPAMQRRPALQAVPGNARKGVALPKLHTTSSLPAAAFLFDEESESDHDRNNSEREQPRANHPAWPEDDVDDEEASYEHPRAYQVIDDDDLGSVMEEDIIDRMGPPAEKRTLSSAASGGPRQKRRRTQPHPNPFKGMPSQRTRQPKITSAFDRAAASSADGERRRRQRSYRTIQSHHRPRTLSSSFSPPPLLSILDFVEPSVPAPNFLRIAARTARSRRSQGKASPSRKLINLGTRQDNRDALSVLQAWRAGKIKPKTKNASRAVPARTLSRTASRASAATERLQPFGDLSPNLASYRQHTAASYTKRPAKEPTSTYVPASLPATASTPGAAPRPAPNLRAFVNTASQNRRLQPLASTPVPQQQKKKQKERRYMAASSSFRPQSMAAAMRPAQLETVVHDQPGRSAFVVKKRALDEMYRRRRKDAALLPDVRLERFFDDQCPAPVVPVPAPDSATAGHQDEKFGDGAVSGSPFWPEPQERTREDNAQKDGAQRSRFRKRYNPRQLDTTAARFVHALDPIPLDLSGPAATTVSTSHVPDAVADPDAGKLYGLGPFGSQYSQHFDIFPLDSGVFFHPSTLVGSGRVAKALGTDFPDGASASGAGFSDPPTFRLDERTLFWSTWDEAASSEYGILFDWLADLLFSTDDTAASSATRATVTGPKAHAVVDFLIGFIDTVVAGPGTEADARKTFVVRSFEVVAGFLDRFDSAATQAYKQQRQQKQGEDDPPMAAADATAHHCLEALTGVLVVSLYLLRICRGEVPAAPAASACRMSAELIQAEDLLTRAAKLLARALVQRGLAEVRATYDELQRPVVRERGIRRHGVQQSLGAWVVLLQVLEHVHIPRAGFWDVAYAALLHEDGGVPIAACTHAGRLEQLWEDMFTLLPLVEFDSAGVVQPGLRRLVPVDGWALPRQALSRVFTLYKSQAHQSPSFNAYCRAIVGRCHYLVQEWGWARRCHSLLGVVFDFYGSQDFGHLRNEEVYRSPRFLEALGEPGSAAAGDGGLAIDSDDKCFHIFLKMLALVLLQLRRLGLVNEMRNLVARTLPNHNRQYLRERDVHQRDLAALRNHHDLLCTLFWAAPPGLRPALHLLEKLVEPASSHKEAVLINLRAWRQLARFVVATGEGYGVFRGLDAWMSRVFQQVLVEQYLSAEADMQKQCARLSAPLVQRIRPGFVQAMAAANRASAMGVLQTCVAAALDVLRQSPTLAVATYCLPAYQLEAILTKMDLVPGRGARSVPSTTATTTTTTTTTTVGWGILDTVLDVVDHYLERLETAMDEQYSSGYDGGGDGGGSSGVDATEEAILMLDHTLAKSLFQATNAFTQAATAVAGPPGPPGPPAPTTETLRCTAYTERCVVIAARLASRLVHAGVYRLSRFFGAGDYCVFDALLVPVVAAGPSQVVPFSHTPRPTGSMALPATTAASASAAQRTYLPLFVASVLQNNVFDFKDLGVSLLELWLLALVKPWRFLAYELRLADVLKQHDLPYVRRATTTTVAAAKSGAAGRPTYATNQAFFACAVTSMRQQLRDTEGSGASRRQQLRSEFARALRRVMQQMRDDLERGVVDGGGSGGGGRLTATEEEHSAYVGFVRGIVALIKSHGGDICAVDGFYYQASRAYAPSPEDPQLQTAGIVAYGLRLGEGEATAGPQLFHYLHNTFHIARAHGQLAGAGAILARGMAANQAVFRFVLERMLPAILQAVGGGGGAARSSGGGSDAVWTLLDVYSSAVVQVLAQPEGGVPRDVFVDDGGGDDSGDGAMGEAVVGLLEDIVAWLPWAAGAVLGDGEDGGDGDDLLDNGMTWAETCVRLQVLVQVAALARALQPTLRVCACLALPAQMHVRLAAALRGMGMLVVESGVRRDGDGDRDRDDDDEHSLFGFLGRLGGRGTAEAAHDGYDVVALPPPPRVYSGGNTAPRNGAQVALFSKTIVRHVHAHGGRSGAVGVYAAAAAEAPGPVGPAANEHSPPSVQTAKSLVAQLRQQLGGWTLSIRESSGRGCDSERTGRGRAVLVS